MSQEIIYTSAPQGLRPGSFGFCTVATTPGMTSTLAERLEAISGYRHVYSPGDLKEHLNPVVYSHLIFRVAGKQQHVLSRVANAGFDYSQRTNKLAHHVVLDASELVSPGPAWILAQPGFSETTWSGAPRLLPQGRACPKGESEAQICTAWQKATGDAGWAGVLAQNTIRGGKTAILIFPEGTEVLPLIQEALTLLPAARRWEVTFSTFFTRLPQGVDCAWRCVLANSTEAIAAVAKQEGLILELGRTLGPAPENDLVQLARTGKQKIQTPRPATRPQPPPTAPIEPDETEVFDPDFLDVELDEELRLTPPEFKSKGKRPTTSVTRSGGPPKLPAKTSRGKRTVLIAGLIAFTVVLVTSVGAFMMFRDRFIAAKKPASELEKEQAPDRDEKRAEVAAKSAEDKGTATDNRMPINKGAKEPQTADEKQGTPNPAPDTVPKEVTPDKAKSEAGDPKSTPPIANHIEGSKPALPQPPPAVDGTPVIAPGNQVASTVKVDERIVMPPTTSEHAAKESSWKWPIEPVFPKEPAMKGGKPNRESPFLWSQSADGRKEIQSLVLIGSPKSDGGSEAFKLEPDKVKKGLWQLSIRRYNSSHLIALLSEDASGIQLKWEKLNEQQLGTDLRKLAACAIVMEFADGNPRLIPFSFLDGLRPLQLGLQKNTLSDQFVLPDFASAELQIVKIDFRNGSEFWELEPPPLTSSNSRSCEVELKADKTIRNRLSIVHDEGQPTQASRLQWDLLHSDGKFTQNEIHDIAKNVQTWVRESAQAKAQLINIKSKLQELDEAKKKVQGQQLIEVAEQISATKRDETNHDRKLENIDREYLRLHITPEIADVISTIQQKGGGSSGALTCCIARLVEHNMQKVLIPLVRIGGDP